MSASETLVIVSGSGAQARATTCLEKGAGSGRKRPPKHRLETMTVAGCQPLRPGPLLLNNAHDLNAASPRCAEQGGRALYFRNVTK